MADPRGKILVVDDEPMVAGLLVEYFHEQGFEMLTAAGGMEALSKLEKHRPNVVLLDARMPQMDGIEVLRKIRERHPQVGVLMMTGHDDVALAQKAIGLGAFDFVLKPFDFDYISRCVYKMMTAGAPAEEQADASLAAASLTYGLVYDLALEVFKATRKFSPEARASLAPALEDAALAAIQRSVGSEKPEVIRALNQIRTLIRFSRDLGDLSDDAHRHLESWVVKARRSVGLA
jgi:two-component system response regulator (stage 0 sporulation protein F)